MSLFGSSPNYTMFNRRAEKSANKGITEGINTLEQGYGSAQDAITAGQTGADTAINQGYNDASGAINNYYGQAGQSLQGGSDQAVNTLNNSLPYFDQMFNTGTQGVDRYGMLAGLNGGDAGYSAFVDSPDYQVSRAAANAGLEDIGRSYAGSGQVGRSMTDAMKYMHNFDTGILNNERNALMPYFGQQAQGAQGIAGVNNNIAGIQNTFGKDMAALQTGQGDALSGLGMWQGTNLAGNDKWGAGAHGDLYTGLAQDKSQMQVNKGQNKANMHLANLAGAQTDSQNTMNMWSSLLGAGTKLAGMKFGA